MGHPDSSSPQTTFAWMPRLWHEQLLISRKPSPARNPIVVTKATATLAEQRVCAYTRTGKNHVKSGPQSKRPASSTASSTASSRASSHELRRNRRSLLQDSSKASKEPRADVDPALPSEENSAGPSRPAHHSHELQSPISPTTSVFSHQSSAADTDLSSTTPPDLTPIGLATLSDLLAKREELEKASNSFMDILNQPAGNRNLGEALMQLYDCIKITDRRLTAAIKSVIFEVERSRRSQDDATSTVRQLEGDAADEIQALQQRLDEHEVRVMPLEAHLTFLATRLREKEAAPKKNAEDIASQLSTITSRLSQLESRRKKSRKLSISKTVSPSQVTVSLSTSAASPVQARPGGRSEHGLRRVRPLFNLKASCPTPFTRTCVDVRPHSALSAIREENLPMYSTPRKASFHLTPLSSRPSTSHTTTQSPMRIGISADRQDWKSFVDYLDLGHIDLGHGRLAQVEIVSTNVSSSQEHGDIYHGCDQYPCPIMADARMTWRD